MLKQDTWTQTLSSTCSDYIAEQHNRNEQQCTWGLVLRQMEEAEELWDWNKYLEQQVKEDAREVGGITAEAITRGSVQGEDKPTKLMQKPRELNTPTDHDMSSIGQTT